MKKILLILISLLFFNILNAEELSYKENLSEINNIEESLFLFKKTLVMPQVYLFDTSSFNCSGTGCEESRYVNGIGNITLYEYERVGGRNSYLVDEEDFFAIDKVENSTNMRDIIITSVGEENIKVGDTAGLRPNVYVKKGVKVTGSGMKSDPWIFVEPNYNIEITLINATIDGKNTYKENIKTYGTERILTLNVEEKYAVKNNTCLASNITFTNNILTISDIAEDLKCTIEYEKVDKIFSYKEEDQEYVIPYSGYYKLEAWGAQGQAEANEEGGLGGYASGEKYFEKGTVLKINTGGTNGYNGGGAGKYNGGGASTIKLNDEVILAAAGGGGGKDGTPGGNDSGEGGEASKMDYTTIEDGGPGSDGANYSGGGSGYGYEYEANCSECYTGENTCQGGTIEYNCSDCYTGETKCVYGCDSEYDPCKSTKEVCQSGTKNGSCKSYKSCVNSSCGCATYNSCQSSSCGCASYKSCQSPSCGCASYDKTQGCVTAGDCKCISYKKCISSSCGCASYKSCASSSCGCASYKSCANSSCGCASYEQITDPCMTTKTVCVGGTVQTNCSSCHHTTTTCAYGCDTRYDECATGHNTCEYGCDTIKVEYKSGHGGKNMIDWLGNTKSEIGKRTGNGEIRISFISEGAI